MDLKNNISEINCRYPVVILSHSLYGAICRGARKLVLNDQTRDLTSEELLQIKLGEFRPLRLVDYYVNNDDPNDIIYKRDEYTFQKDNYHRHYTIDLDNIHNYYLLNEKTGEITELYKLVKCNHCPCCRKSKVEKYRNRCIFEAERHNNKPFFVTLTYNDYSYPTNPYDLEFVTSEIQKFNKRLRKHLSLNGFSTDYKYFIVSEYGSQNGRLHYHALFFGLPKEMYDIVPNTYSDNGKMPVFYKFTDFLRRSWKKGYIVVEEAFDVSGKYCMKYINKQCGNVSTKMLHSKGFGKGIIVDRLREYRKNADLQSITLNINGIQRDFPIDTYISTLLYPSFKRSVKKEFRDLISDVFELSVKIHYLKTRGLFIKDFNFDEFYQFDLKFRKEYDIIINLMDLKDDEILFDISNGFNIDILYSDYCDKLDELKNYHYDFHFVKYLSGLREYHVLSSNFNDLDITQQEYNAKIYFADQFNKESDNN